MLNEGVVRRLRITGLVCAAFAVLVGTLALIGWLTGNELLKGALVAGITIKANTAIALLALGLSLALLAPEPRRLARTLAGQGLALFAAAIGAATLVEHLFGWDLGIDQLLFREAAGAAATAMPNRMGPPAATCLPLLGIALFLLARPGSSLRPRFQGFAAAAMVLAFVSILGFLQGAEALYGIGRISGIALPTALVLFLLGFGILAARPAVGFMGRLASDDSGAVLIRRLLPVAVVVPFATTWIRLAGQNAGLYSPEFGRALSTLAFIFTFSGLLWWTGGVIRRKERASAAAQAEIHDRLVHSLESMTDGFMACDAEWRITYMNAAAERANGISRERTIGRDWWDVFAGARGTIVEENCRRAKEERTRVHFETFYEPFGRWFESELYPTPDGGLAAYFRDVTERRRALAEIQQSEELFRTLGETVPDLLWVSDATGRPIFENPAWRKFTGLSHEEVLEKTWNFLHHPDDRPVIDHLWAQAHAAGTGFRHEFRFRRHDGTFRWCVSQNVPVKDAAGRVVKWVGTLTDIEERRQAEAALRDTDRRKNEFLAMLAHELRNPLAPVRNSVRLLRHRKFAEPETQWAIEVMDRQVDHLARLIDDLVDVSRISHNKLELRKQRVAFGEIVAGAIESARPVIDEHGHELVTDVPRETLFLEADAVRVAQVFMNLLANAAKYTPRGGVIRFTATREGSDLIVEVADNGIGIAADQMPHLFEMFFQTEGVLQRTQGGLGIGLALVRHLVQLHGGSVSAYSAGLAQGSTFTVRLPLAVDQSVAPAAASGTPEPARIAARRVLVVDDNEDAAISLGMLLRMAGAEVHTAHDGEEAIAVAARVEPQVVLLDIGLPKKNGYEVAGEIRRTPWGAAALLVALTGWGQPEDRERSRQAGFDRHVVKPIHPDVLMTLLDEIPQPAR